MLSEQTIAIVKATAPAVAARAEEITRRFYTLMFTGDPQVMEYFNQAHQHSGGQQHALAGAICAYAANIDNLGVLGPAVELIAQKHCSLGIEPQHYPIVGKHLLVAVAEILGDAITEEVAAAWGEAYNFLADVLVAREVEIYAAQAAAPGGWNGYRPFVVDRKQKESELITSFYLRPQDGGPLPPFEPGQYTTVKVQHPTTPTSPRNYSLSDKPGNGHYRISVKREPSPAPGAPAGLISNYLHDEIHVGDVLELRPPNGDFRLRLADDHLRPIVLMSGGVGITPVLSMLKTLVEHGCRAPIHFVHCARNSEIHAFREEVEQLSDGRENVNIHFRYSDPLADDVTAGRCHTVGFLTADFLDELSPSDEADYYFCGPKPFMGAVHFNLKRRGVDDGQIHYEFFGPKDDFAAPPAEETTPSVLDEAHLAG